MSSSGKTTPLQVSIAWRFLRGRGNRLLDGTARAALIATCVGVMAMVIAMAMVKINNPRLMLSCGDEDLLLNCSSRRVTSYCDETGQYETVSTYLILILILCFSRSRQV